MRAILRHIGIDAALIALLALTVAAQAGPAPPAPQQLPLRPKDIATFVAFSADSRALVVIVKRWVPERNGYQWEVALFDLARGEEVWRVVPPAGMMPQDALFSPDGRRLATRSWGYPIVLWDVRQGKALCKLESSKQVYEAVFSPDGRRVVGRVTRTGAPQLDPYTVAIWDVASGKKVGQIKAGTRGEIQAFALAADGEHILVEHHRLVGVDAGGQVMVPWNVRTHVWSLATEKDLGTVGRLTEYWGTGDEYFSPGHNLYLAGAAGFGYCRRDLYGLEHFWTPWAGRIALSQSGRPVVLADYRPANPVLERSGAPFTLVNPEDGKPLHGRDHFAMGHLHAVALAPDGTKVAAVEFDNNREPRLLLWDVTDLADKVRIRPELDEERLTALWSELSGDDDRRAHAAMWGLAAAPARSVTFLRTKVRPVPPVEWDGEQVRRWITDLDSDEFQVRDAATRELERLGGLAKPALEKALATKPPLEAARRIERLLERLDQPVPPEELSALRAVDVLEQIGTEEARLLLRSLAEGAEAASLTRAAKQALARLASQGKESP
jgi:hypothetical protein